MTVYKFTRSHVRNDELKQFAISGPVIDSCISRPFIHIYICSLLQNIGSLKNYRYLKLMHIQGNPSVRINQVSILTK